MKFASDKFQQKRRKSLVADLSADKRFSSLFS